MFSRSSSRTCGAWRLTACGAAASRCARVGATSRGRCAPATGALDQCLASHSGGISDCESESRLVLKTHAPYQARGQGWKLAIPNIALAFDRAEEVAAIAQLRPESNAPYAAQRIDSRLIAFYQSVVRDFETSLAEADGLRDAGQYQDAEQRYLDLHTRATNYPFYAGTHTLRLSRVTAAVGFDQAQFLQLTQRRSRDAKLTQLIAQANAAVAERRYVDAYRYGIRARDVDPGNTQAEATLAKIAAAIERLDPSQANSMELALLKYHPMDFLVWLAAARKGTFSKEPVRVAGIVLQVFGDRVVVEVASIERVIVTLNKPMHVMAGSRCDTIARFENTEVSGGRGAGVLSNAPHPDWLPGPDSNQRPIG